jgi:1-pyrroline-5-carboxylate dehydrogenase
LKEGEVEADRTAMSNAPEDLGGDAARALAYPSATAGILHLGTPANEPARSLAAGSSGQRALRASLDELGSRRHELPLVIGGRQVRTGRTFEAVLPHDRHHVLADVNAAGKSEVGEAVAAACRAARSWSLMPWEERAAVFLRAAHLAGGPWRDSLVAATMLGQSKTASEAEADVAELVDFFRFNVAAMARMYEEQPISTARALNRIDYRPLEGFVLAVTPFNFVAIAGNLPSAPALLGNTAVWKPASTATLPAQLIMSLLAEAGLPAGVINLLYGHGPEIGALVLQSPALAGIHFTGSTATFQHLWTEVGMHISRYRSYPRIVGETGGKGFVLVHVSADTGCVVKALLDGAFAYQGQKCSAATRLYVPDSLWPAMREELEQGIKQLVVGDVRDHTTDIGAVIDSAAFERHRVAIAHAKSSQETRIITGGVTDSGTGYFVHPTLVETADPNCRLLHEELFGPILTVYTYREDSFDATLDLVDRTSPYALTGSVFATDPAALTYAIGRLRHSAGNLYLNDKPTGAVVGQQPFGGSRASGTNDKAGSLWNLIRWSSPRTIKESFATAGGTRSSAARSTRSNTNCIPAEHRPLLPGSSGQHHACGTKEESAHGGIEGRKGS